MALLDSSKEMLYIAKEKLKSEIEKGTVDFVAEAVMPPLPFSNGLFDAVIFNHVILIFVISVRDIRDKTCLPGF